MSNRVELLGELSRYELRFVRTPVTNKEQLRLDEARSFVDRALAAFNGQLLDGKGNTMQRVALLGAATSLLLRLRSGEVVDRRVRDLDDDDRVVWIPTAKTQAGIRRVEVPDVLVPHLIELAGDRPPWSSCSRASPATASGTGRRACAAPWASGASPCTASAARTRPRARGRTRTRTRSPRHWATRASP
jgi:integrase